MPTASLEDIRARIGTEVGTSGWMTVDQERIGRFAEATEDQQFIHVDPDQATQTPFGGTVAHGFLAGFDARAALFAGQECVLTGGATECDACAADAHIILDAFF